MSSGDVSECSCGSKDEIRWAKTPDQNVAGVWRVCNNKMPGSQRPPSRWMKNQSYLAMLSVCLVSVPAGSSLHLEPHYRAGCLTTVHSYRA